MHNTGVKEMNLVATVEHLRDHRPHMVMTKASPSIKLLVVVSDLLTPSSQLLAIFSSDQSNCLVALCCWVMAGHMQGTGS